MDGTIKNKKDEDNFEVEYDCGLCGGKATKTYKDGFLHSDICSNGCFHLSKDKGE